MCGCLDGCVSVSVSLRVCVRVCVCVGVCECERERERERERVSECECLHISVGVFASDRMVREVGGWCWCCVCVGVVGVVLRWAGNGQCMQELLFWRGCVSLSALHVGVWVYS